MSEGVADSTTGASNYISELVPSSPEFISPPDSPNVGWERGEIEDPRIPDDRPIAHRLRNKHCQCPKIKRDCQIIVDNLEVLRRKIAQKDCLACGALRFHLRNAQSFLRDINKFLSNGNRVDSYDLAVAWDFLDQKRSCFATRHKWWTLKRKNKKKT